MDASGYPRLFRLRMGAAAFAALVGLLALVGWGAGIPGLVQIYPGLQPMTPAGAIFLVVTGSALAAEGALALALSTMVLLGGLALVGAALAGAATLPVLPTSVSAPIVASNMILGGLALLLRDARGPRGAWAAQICALLVVLNALRSLLGFVISDEIDIPLVITSVGLSPQGAFSIMILGLGLLAARPDDGFMALIVSERAGGQLMRWLVLAGVAFPIIAALIFEVAWQTRLFGIGTTISLFLLANLVIFYRTAAAFDRVDHERTAAEERLALANADLERRVAERTAALRDREAQIGAIGDNLPSTMIYQTIADDSGQVQFSYVSAGVERISGYRADEIIADSGLLYNQLAPEDRVRLATAEYEAGQSLTVLDIEVRKHTPWGLRWSHIRSRPRQFADGRIAWDGIEVDITAQKEVEAALERDRRYQAALFACSQALLRGAEAADRDAALLDVLSRLLASTSADRAFLMRTVEDSLLGLYIEIPIAISAPGIPSVLTSVSSARLPLDQLPPWVKRRLGTDEPTVVSREGLGPSDKSLAALFDSFGIQSFVVLPLRPDGQQWGGIGFHACTAPREWDDQEILLLRTAAELVSSAIRRWQGEDELRRREGLLSTLFDILPVGVSIVDAERRPLRLNSAVSQIIGLDLPALMGEAYLQIRYTHPDGSPIAHEELPASQAIGGTLVRDMEVGIIRPDGQLRWASISAAPLPIPGHGAALVTVDITERKRIEEERLIFERKLLETQHLESLGVLAGGVAHDFNNILAAILGHAELARLEIAADSDVGANLNAIILGARRAADLTAQMLAYAGRGRFFTQAVDLNTAVLELRDLLRSTLPGNIGLWHFLAPDLPPVIADGTQIRQVLLNLLTNASEAIVATGGGGTLSVVTGHDELTQAALAEATFSAANPGSFVYLEVRDTGCGMDPATLARIFDPFFSTKFTGRGLGLPAVQGIVRAHRGALFVRSAPGQGSTFRVCFPLAPAAALDSVAGAP
ncbi:MAG: PAS domain S-box protein [Chloroflexales bacterium]|nr:PAS domain S-box protein [Chloroflexales bacterium]